jgi:hypothetical protein
MEKSHAQEDSSVSSQAEKCVLSFDSVTTHTQSKSRMGGGVTGSNGGATRIQIGDKIDTSRN